MARRLDYRPKAETFAWLDQREEEVFAHYLECGRIKTVMAELRKQAEAEGWPISLETIFEWLKATDERAARWEEAKHLAGYLSADTGEEIAMNATQQDANASRLKYEAKMRAAEWQNRAVFGKRPEVAIALGVGGEWSQALATALDADVTVIRSEPQSEPHTADLSTRALPAPRTVPEQGSEGAQEPCQEGGDGS